MLNQVVLIGKINHLVKLKHEDTYKARLTTEQGSHRIYIPKAIIKAAEIKIKDFNNNNSHTIAIKGKITQTLTDQEIILVERLSLMVLGT